MEKEKVSIIIPVYNNAKFLNQCLESVLNQTHKNFEAILVCDKGKDNSHDICEKFSRRDARIKFFLRGIGGGGVSSARNLGLDNVDNDTSYIAFIDADDWIEPTYIEDLLDCFKKFPETDLACARFKFSKPSQKPAKNPAPIVKLSPPHKALLSMIGKENFGLALWNKLYKKELVGNLRFDENIGFAEDTLWVYTYISKCKHIAFTNQKLYHYIKHPESTIANGKFKDRKSEINTYQEIIAIAGKTSQSQKIIMQTWQYIIMLEKYFLLLHSKEDFPKDKARLKTIIKSCRPSYFACRKHLSFIQKQAYLLEKVLRV